MQNNLQNLKNKGCNAGRKQRQYRNMPKCVTIKVKQKCLLVQVADSQAKYKPVTSKSKSKVCAMSPI